MFRKTSVSVALLVAALAVPACSPKAGGAGEKGAATLAAPIDKNTYVNEQFGLTITAPEGWYVMDSAVTKRLMDVGLEMSTSEMDARAKAAVKASADNGSNLFGFMKYAPGKPVESNPGILGVAEDVTVAPGIERGSDYLFHVKTLLGQTGMQANIAEGFQTIKIDGKDFDRMDMEIVSMGRTMFQRYYAARHGNNVVSFIQTYQSPEELAELDKVLQSVKLKW